REVDWRIVPGGTWPEPANSEPTRLAGRHDAAHREAAGYLRALALAWRDDPDAGADIAESPSLPSGDADVLAWLREGPLPPALMAWVEQGGQLLLPVAAAAPVDAQAVVWRDDAGAPLLQAATHGRGRLLQLTRPLAPAAMPQLLEPSFPRKMREVLQRVPPPTAVAAADYSPQAGEQAPQAEPHDLRPWLALVIALLFLLERWLASARRRGAAA
ncbi:hypothetical protein ACQYWP_17360, partial [Luteimonas sp. SDU101]